MRDLLDGKYQNAVIQDKALARIICQSYLDDNSADLSVLELSLAEMKERTDDDDCVRLADLIQGHHPYIDCFLEEPAIWLEDFDEIPDYDGSGATLYVLDADEWELEQKIKNRKNPWNI